VTAVVLRAVAPDDVEHLQRALYDAIAWNPERELPPYDVVIAHPEVERYHRDWGRSGDIGVIAEVEGAVAGVAFCRLFTARDHGEGYVDERTPEVAVAVAEEHRGAGIGGRLLRELADAAQAAGFERLSLSVDAANPARRLYERLGYRELSVADGDVLMLLELETGHTRRVRPRSRLRV
jgi:ribosomal protein S18 acetylase RimI-like enzyme